MYVIVTFGCNIILCVKLKICTLFHNETTYFSREKERKVGPDGFLDSSRFTHPYGSTGSGKSPRPKSDTSPRGGVIHLTRRKEKEQREFDKRIKVIEVCKGIIGQRSLSSVVGKRVIRSLFTRQTALINKSGFPLLD